MIYKKTHELIIDDIFLELEGFIPSVRILLKIESFNPMGSIKAKTASGLLNKAEDEGFLRPGGRVIESTSGSLGIALSSICAAKNYEFIAVVDPNTSKHSMAAMEAFGASLVVVDEPDENGGFLASRIDYIKKRTQEEEDLVWLNQYANSGNPDVHYQMTAESIYKEVGEADYLYIGSGTTGTLMGCAKFFRKKSRGTSMVAVDTLGSVTFHFPPEKRYIPGIGTSRRPEICQDDLVDKVVLVPEIEAVRMCRRIAKEYGLLLGGSTGSVLSAIESERCSIPEGSSVVAISPDLGERYLDTIYNDSWVEKNFDASL